MLFPLGRILVLCCALLHNNFYLSWLSTVAASTEIRITDDPRRVIDFGTFGYSNSGVFELEIEGFSLKDAHLHETTEPVGFTLDAVPSASYARMERNYGTFEEPIRGKCFIDDPLVVPHVDQPNRRRTMPLEDWLQHRAPHVALSVDLLLGKSFSHLAPIGAAEFSVDATTYKVRFFISEPNLYALFFYNCKQPNKEGTDSSADWNDGARANFVLRYSMYNTEPKTGRRNYLGIGYEPLVRVYYVATALFLLLTVLWIRDCSLHKQWVHKIHRFMTALIVLKTLSAFFTSMRYATRAASDLINAWTVFYYVFLTLKGLVMFTVIMLLGTGWSFLKPCLNDRDKNVLMFVLPLQLLINIAAIVIQETSEGSVAWGFWWDILPLLDVVCCCAVLLPTVWSINTLVETDDEEKSRLNLHRLRQFRTHYLLIVGYIYTTRIGVSFLENILAYQNLWMASVVNEVCNFLFYAYVGRNFRPHPRGLYSPLPNDETPQSTDSLHRNYSDDIFTL